MKPILGGAATVVLATGLAAQQVRGEVGQVVLRIVDHNGGPVTSARITVGPASARQLGAERSAPPAWIVEPKDLVQSTFLLEDVPAGRVTLFVVAPPLAPARSLPITIDRGGGVEVTVQLLRGGQLEGRVLDIAGRPVADADVTTDLRSHGPDPAAAEPGSCVIFRHHDVDGERLPEDYTRAKTRTGRDGSFRLVGLVPAIHELCVRHPAFAETRRALPVTDGGSLSLPITLREGTRLHGVVLLAGQPAARARVTLTRWVERGEPFVDGISVEADDQGRFHTRQRLAAGQWRVGAARPATGDNPFVVLRDLRLTNRTLLLRDGEVLPPLTIELTKQVAPQAPDAAR